MTGVPDVTGGKVAVVTDSTSYLPPELAAQAGVAVVPLQVVVGGELWTEGDPGRGPRDLAQALRGKASVSTSRPAPAVFADVYDRLVAQGAESVVSVHLSGELSGTVEAAQLAARDAPVPVTVVDSRSLGMGMGFAVLAGAAAASRGDQVDQVADVVRDVAARTSVRFSLATLEHLRRGGRIGAAQALIGSALAVKPLLQLVDGRVEVFDRVRTMSRATTRLVEVTAADAGDRAVDVTVHHLDAADRAEDVAVRLRAVVPGLRRLLVVESGAVVGAHVGPGMVAVVLAPAG